MKGFVIASALVAAVSASPVVKRATTTSAIDASSARSMGSSMMANMTGTMMANATMPNMTMSAMSGSASMTSSAVMPMSTGMMSGNMTMTGNETAAELLYPCPTGYDLGYAITQMSYNASLQELLTVAGSFQNATWMYYLNGTGGNDVGATRYLATENGTKHEVLSQYFTDRENVAVQLVMNLTSGPLMAMNGAMISNYSTVFQLYHNNSASMGSENITTAKLFCNYCANNRTLGHEAVLSSLNMGLNNLETIVMGGNVTYPGLHMNPDTMMSTMMTRSSMMSTMSSSTSMMSNMSRSMPTMTSMPSMDSRSPTASSAMASVTSLASALSSAVSAVSSKA